MASRWATCNAISCSSASAWRLIFDCTVNATQRACPVLEVTDPGDPEPKRTALGADLRTDLPRYAIFRDGVREHDAANIMSFWEPDFVAFLLGSGITFDQALQRAGIRRMQHRWVLRTDVAHSSRRTISRAAHCDDAPAEPGPG